MDKRVTKIIIAIVLIIVGVAVLAIFNWNVFELDLPPWVKILSTIIGIPFMIWAVSSLLNTNRKQK